MAWQSRSSVVAWEVDTYQGFGIILFKLKEYLKEIGWTVMSSSDGITYFPSSDGITQHDVGAGGMNNGKSWYRIRQPAGGSAPYSGTREFMIQKDGATFVGRYSKAGTFTGGSPGILVHPTAADQMDLLSGISGGLFSAATTQRMAFNFVGDDNGDFGFSWALFFSFTPYFNTAVSTLKLHVIYFDAMKPNSFPYNAGNLSQSDQDPYVIHIHSGDIVQNGKAWNRYNLSGAAHDYHFEAVGPSIVSGISAVIPCNAVSGGLSPHPHTDKLFTMQISYVSIIHGWKGTSSLFIAAASYAEGLNPYSNDDGENFIGISLLGRSAILAPWDSSVPLRK